MKENTTAKALKGIGIAVIVICVVGAFIIGAQTPNEIIPITIIISGVISGTTFIGLGEIINLLQKSANTQEAILECIQNKAPRQKHYNSCFSGNNIDDGSQCSGACDGSYDCR